jgi:hypothetical protein
LSTLTKVFVILLVLFSVSFTAMTVSIVARTNSWKENYESAIEQKLVAETNLRNLIASNAAELASARDTIKAQLEDVGDLEQELEKSVQRNDELEANLIQAASEKSTAEAINRALVSQLQVAQTTAEEYRAQRDELEKQSIERERRNIDLNDRVNELTARVAVFIEQKRQFEQQINILRTENEKLAAAMRQPGLGATMEAASSAVLPGVSAQTPVSAMAVRGKILEVDGNRLTISVGSADGVKKGMVFVIHRAGDYVGDLKISHVAPDQSAGHLIQSRLEPSPEDLVTDAVSIASSR